MSYRIKVCHGVRLGTLVLSAAVLVYGQTVTVTPSPGNINLSYLEGGTLPAVQTVQIKSTGAGTFTATITPTGTTSSVLWINASPNSGALPGKVGLFVNPTGLEVGTYTAAVKFTPAAAVPQGTPGTTNVKLVVTAPPPILTMTANQLAFLAPPAHPAPQTIQLTTSSGPVVFSADVGKVSWLTVTPTIGKVLPGAPVILTVTADASLLSPSLIAASTKITLTETGSGNKTQTIAVTLTVSYQPPTVTNIWPGTGKAGAPATTVTLFGTRFGAASVAKIQGPPAVSLSTTYISSTVLSAVIPATQMAAGTPLVIMVTNPAPGGDSASTATFTFTPTIDEAVNAASYAPSAAPGELITLFGDNIGPVAPASLTMTAGYVDTTLSGVSVKVDNLDAPMIYVSQHQITVQVPYEVTLGLAKAIVVTNGANPAANGTIDIAATAPGIFTLSTSGGGQAVVINTSAAAGHAATLNSAKNPARIGDAVTFWLTGEGVYTSIPTPVDGYVIPLNMILASMPQLVAAVGVTIGGISAPVTYAGPFNGGILGVLQINVTVPNHSTGNTVPVVVTIGGINSSSFAGNPVTLATAP